MEAQNVCDVFDDLGVPPNNINDSPQVTLLIFSFILIYLIGTHISHKCFLIIFIAYRSMIGFEKSMVYPRVDISVNIVDQACCMDSVV